MAPRKSATVNSENGNAFKIWKENPPGPEQKELNRMFQSGLISTADTPAKIRSRYPMFMAFAPKTFALHFRTTKAKAGLNAVAATNNTIPELGGIDGMEEIETPSFAESSSGAVNSDCHLAARNFPFVTWVYMDHAQQKEIVCVAVPTVAGSRDIRFAISDDGMQLSIDYVWPETILDPNVLFYDVKDEEDDAMSMSHPMVYSYRVRLDELELSDKSRPVASLLVDLPLKVQRELGTYKKQALKCGDSRVVLLELTAYQKKRVICDADNSIKF